jgi:hypothetical protein
MHHRNRDGNVNQVEAPTVRGVLREAKARSVPFQMKLKNPEEVQTASR